MFVFFLSEIVISVVVLALNGYINNAKVTTYVGIGTSFADSLVIGFAKCNHFINYFVVGVCMCVCLLSLVRSLF
jgi:hypothetical protein